jgi:hypothetical protein
MNHPSCPQATRAEASPEICNNIAGLHLPNMYMTNEAIYQIWKNTMTPNVGLAALFYEAENSCNQTSIENAAIPNKLQPHKHIPAGLSCIICRRAENFNGWKILHHYCHEKPMFC